MVKKYRIPVPPPNQPHKDKSKYNRKKKHKIGDNKEKYDGRWTSNKSNKNK